MSSLLQLLRYFCGLAAIAEIHYLASFAYRFEFAVPAPASIPTDFDGIHARLASLKQETEMISLPTGIALDTTVDAKLLAMLDHLP